MSKKVSETKQFKVIIAALILFMNIAFYTLEAEGLGTGFQAAYDIHPLFGILLSAVIAVPFLSYVYFIIKDV